MAGSTVKRWAGKASNEQNDVRKIVGEASEVLAEKEKIREFQATAARYKSESMTSHNDERIVDSAKKAAEYFRKAAALIKKYPGSSQSYAVVLENSAKEMDARAKDHS